jgi:amino-acid N-acetyltransferase
MTILNEVLMEDLQHGTARTDAAVLARRAGTIRRARADEVLEILALFDGEVKAGRMLPRNADEMIRQIENWMVAVDGDTVVGCVSLVFFTDELCELRSLAVRPEYRGGGLGGRLIRMAVEMARVRGMRRVLTLTRAVRVFELNGFVRDLVGNYPEKVWKDCTSCPLRARCDEVALIYDQPTGAGL